MPHGANIFHYIELKECSSSYDGSLIVSQSEFANALDLQWSDFVVAFYAIWSAIFHDSFIDCLSFRLCSAGELADLCLDGGGVQDV